MTEKNRSVRMGDRVTVHYIGTLDNGRIFDQRDADDPLTFTLGAGEVFTALEEQVLGMAVGEVRNIQLAAEQAYGPRLEANLLRVKRELFPPARELRVGEKLSVGLGETQKVMRVRHVGKDEVMLDGNHDLAGCSLTFALQLVAIA